MSKKLLHIKENIIKNIILVFLALVAWPLLSNALMDLKAEQTNDFLLVVSMLLVTACFANFAFTYEKSRLTSWGGASLVSQRDFCLHAFLPSAVRINNNSCRGCFSLA